MGRRRDILLTIKNAIDGLEVAVGGEPRAIHTTDTLFDPTKEAYYPIFSVTPAPETVVVGIMGLTMDRTMMINLFGYVDGGSRIVIEEDNLSPLAEAAEECVQAIMTKLTSQGFLDMVACTFSIIQIGPVTVEHAELEEPLAYMNVPLTVQWVE